MLTKLSVLPIHIDHPLLLMLVAELALLLALPVEGWSCAAARFRTLPVLYIHHPFLHSNSVFVNV